VEVASWFSLSTLCSWWLRLRNSRISVLVWSVFLLLTMSKVRQLAYLSTQETSACRPGSCVFRKPFVFYAVFENALDLGEETNFLFLTTDWESSWETSSLFACMERESSHYWAYSLIYKLIPHHIISYRCRLFRELILNTFFMRSLLFEWTLYLPWWIFLGLANLLMFLEGLYDYLCFVYLKLFT